LSIDLSFLYPLYSIDPRAVWKGQLVLLLILATTAAVIVIPLNPESHAMRWLKRCGAAGIIIMVVLQFALVARYLYYPSYLNHAETIVAEASWLGWEGYPLYPPLGAGDIYGFPYGPALFQVTGFSLWLFGPSIGASKIPGLTAFALSQILSFVILRRAGARVAEALTMTGMQCLVQAGFTDQGFVSGVRSDALLFLGAQTALLAATAAPTLLTAAVLGLLAGICANLKIHGILYVLPAFVFWLCRSPSAKIGLRLACAAGAVAAVALAVPFSPANVSLFEYYHYYQTLQHTPWNRWLFEQNIIFEAMCFAPFLLLYALFTPTLPRAFYWFFGTLVLCMTIVSFPAAVTGAGAYHLLPFLPSVVWGFVVMRREVGAGLRDARSRGRYEGLAAGLMAAILLGYGPIVNTSWGTMLHIFAQAPLVNEGLAEIDGVLHDNPDRKVAVGPGAETFDAQSLRVIPVFRGNPLPIDSYTWMVLKLNGVSEESVRRAIRECRVDIWLLPTEAPFVTISHLDGSNIYSAEVLADFYAAYGKQVSGRIFDQWRCKRDEGASGRRG